MDNHRRQDDQPTETNPVNYAGIGQILLIISPPADINELISIPRILVLKKSEAVAYLR